MTTFTATMVPRDWTIITDENDRRIPSALIRMSLPVNGENARDVSVDTEPGKNDYPLLNFYNSQRTQKVTFMRPFGTRVFDIRHAVNVSPFTIPDAPKTEDALSMIIKSSIPYDAVRAIDVNGKNWRSSAVTFTGGAYVSVLSDLHKGVYTVETYDGGNVIQRVRDAVVPVSGNVTVRLSERDLIETPTGDTPRTDEEAASAVVNSTLSYDIAKALDGSGRVVATSDSVRVIANGYTSNIAGIPEGTFTIETYRGTSVYQRISNVVVPATGYVTVNLTASALITAETPTEEPNEEPTEEPAEESTGHRITITGLGAHDGVTLSRYGISASPALSYGPNPIVFSDLEDGSYIITAVYQHGRRSRRLVTIDSNSARNITHNMDIASVQLDPEQDNNDILWWLLAGTTAAAAGTWYYIKTKESE